MWLLNSFLRRNENVLSIFFMYNNIYTYNKNCIQAIYLCAYRDPGFLFQVGNMFLTKSNDILQGVCRISINSRNFKIIFMNIF